MREATKAALGTPATQTLALDQADVIVTLQADVLRSKTPGGVRRELAAILLGHSVVWWLIHLAAEMTNTPAEDISFTAAARTALAFSHGLAHAQGQHRRDLFSAMLRHIARQTNRHPFGRVEPRMVKRDPVRYEYLRMPRLACPHALDRFRG